MASAVYDGLLVLAVLMVLTVILFAFQGRARVAPLTVAQMGLWGYLYRAAVALAIAAYFGSTWTYRGQTLGMKAWRIRLASVDGTAPKLSRALVRLALTSLVYVPLIGGVGVYMMHHGHDKQPLWFGLPLVVNFAVARLRGGATLVDRLSGTRVLRADGASERGGSRPPQ